MVQITVDTNTDTLPELEEAMRIIATAIQRRSGMANAPTQPSAPVPARESAAPQSDEETAIDTPFLKITVKTADEAVQDGPAASPAGAKLPTLNQLLTDESLTEEELGKLFKEAQERDKERDTKTPPKSKGGADAEFIEIVDYDEEP